MLKNKKVNNSEKVTRLEIINHANNTMKKGRLFTIRNPEFSKIEVMYQDDNRTLKIFLL